MRFEHLHMPLREEIISKKTWKLILILLAKFYCFYALESTFIIKPKLKLRDLKVQRMWKRKQKFLFPNSVSQSHDPVIIVNSFLLISPSRNVSPHTTTYVKHLVYILTQIGSSYTQFCNFHFSLKIRSIYLDLYLPFSACIAGVPNPRAVDRYQSAACYEPGRTAGGEK